MSQMSNLTLVLDDLIACGEKLIETANAIKESFTAEDTVKLAPKKPEKTEPEKAASQKEPQAPAKSEPETETKPLTKEDVRAVLAQKSSAEFKDEVKALLKKYGASQLKQVKPDDYAALLADAESLGKAQVTEDA